MNTEKIWELVSQYTEDHLLNFGIVKNYLLSNLLLNKVAEKIQPADSQKIKQYLGYLFIISAERALMNYHNTELANLSAKDKVAHLLIYGYCLVQPLMLQLLNNHEIFIDEINETDINIFGEALVDFLVEYDPKVDPQIALNIEAFSKILSELNITINPSLAICYAIMDILSQNPENKKFLVKLLFKYYHIIPTMIGLLYSDDESLSLIQEIMLELAHKGKLN